MYRRLCHRWQPTCVKADVLSAEQALRPDLILSVGTAGGFAARGAAIGDVFVATGFANHDRRIPLPVKLKSKACQGSACCLSLRSSLCNACCMLLQ